jgi:hypothetical protein
LKKTIWFACWSMIAAALSVSAEELTPERQTAIIERYMYVTGQTATLPAALADITTGKPLPEKCGTSAILEYMRNRDRMDRRIMQALGVEDEARPVCDTSYGVPGGHVLIHYDTTGINAPWQVNVDSDGDGIPNYIESIALAADSCWVHLFEDLALPTPLVDSSCVNGGDERIDIYLWALPEGTYGYTYPQPSCNNDNVQHEVSWVVLDHDFQLIPEYEGRPLDAARITLAHEMFHSSQFAMDITEHLTWMEMSAVWMEEEVYDNINDYYLFDYLFFDNPRVSLQFMDTLNAGNPLNFHMYESVFFPIYLSEKYGRDVIKAVWQHAEALGVGPDYLEAVSEVVDSASLTPEHVQTRCQCYDTDGGVCLVADTIHQDLASALMEFAVWNYFTGPYADQAPGGIGYSEAANYSSIPLDSMDVRRGYPSRTVTDPTPPPAPNGAAYVRLENFPDIGFDSLLSMYIKPDPEAIVRWGVSAIFQRDDNPDSLVVVSDVVDVWETWICTDSVQSGCSSWLCTDSAYYTGGRYLSDMLGDWVCLRCKDTIDCVCGLDPTPACADTTTCADSARVINLRPYRSITLIMTPSTPNFGPYLFGNHVDFDFSVFVNASPANLAPAVLTPYPNPAVVSEMDGEDLKFRFSASTDDVGYPTLTNPVLQLDIYTVAGELVQTLEYGYGDDRVGPRPGGIYEIGWNMKNQSGKDVASGVYLVVARLFDRTGRQTEVAEKQVKVAVIR